MAPTSKTLLAIRLVDSKEVLTSEVANPIQRMNSEEWTQVSHDRIRNDNCQQMIFVEHPGSSFYSFSHDPTARNKAYRRGSIRLCESSEIWFASNADGSDGSDGSKMIIEKYSQAGDSIYKARFTKPEPTGDSYGSIIGPTFRAEGGYVNFEWWNTNQTRGLREIYRRMRVRFKEPLSPIRLPIGTAVRSLQNRTAPLGARPATPANDVGPADRSRRRSTVIHCHNVARSCVRESVTTIKSSQGASASRLS